MLSLPPTSLWDGVEDAACSILGIASLRHRSALRSLDISGRGLVSDLYRVIADNYVRGSASAYKDRSRENWRWCCIQPQIGQGNRSREVVLERAIAAACHRSGRSDWANQIPVASGLIPGASDGRRAIDLVHQRAKGHFEFIELKIASDTPLSAAIQIIGYACVWLLARYDRPSRVSLLLDADRVDLRVLAPAQYYAPFELHQIEASLDQDLKALFAPHGLTLSFGYDVLPDQLSAPSTLPDAELLALLSSRYHLPQPMPR